MLTLMTREKFGASFADFTNPLIRQQLEESMLIFDDLTGIKPLENPNHPVLEMWRGYEYALGIRSMMGNMEWTFHRGFADHTYMRFFYKAIKEMKGDDPEFTYEVPPWISDPAVILSHRSNLARRFPEEYSGTWNTCPANWPYIWPRNDDTEDGYQLWISRSDKKRVREGTRARPDSETLGRIVNWP